MQWFWNEILVGSKAHCNAQQCTVHWFDLIDKRLQVGCQFALIRFSQIEAINSEFYFHLDISTSSSDSFWYFGKMLKILLAESDISHWLNWRHIQFPPSIPSFNYTLKVLGWLQLEYVMMEENIW